MSSEQRTIKRVEIRVWGQVQRVFFRSQAAKKARELNLTGWVRNESDDSVKIIAEGEEENLKRLIDWSKKGPLLARVDRIEVKWEESRGEFKEFNIVYS